MNSDSLIFTLVHQAELSKEQAAKALIVVFDHAKAKCPVLRGNINTFLKEELETSETLEFATFIE
jgi:hypothetical protein